ncbi:hypothetical protein G3570_02620 [Balneolaceae bacterium YR4-1]|uniref:DUF2231 domain-containing protein n=1 Tax=Halalkalibaculum roseum TaxID=2709311 RepID=A0A6M1SRR2_9BACT|nr:DUF2231 domain-containing protein [Halalkalibaculum roseum]NGP75510.1 hypothetical protein [Halalkalibaculum roseum]
MSIIPEWAPNIHPIIVHFPIALIFMAVLMDLLNLFLPDKRWDDLKSTILYGAGTLAALISYYTGTLAGDSVFLPSEAQSVLNSHSEWAWWTIWFFVAYLALRLIFHRLDIIDQFKFRVIILLTVLPGLFMLYETGEHGAEMVFGYGVGTGQLIQKEQKEITSTDSLEATNQGTFTVEENGDWSWRMSPNAVSSLLENFRWMKGSAQSLNPSVVQSGDLQLLSISGDSLSSFFTTTNSYQNVQVDYYLNLTDFEGEIMLLNHVKDAQNYDFVNLSTDGTITQGRVTDGSREVFAEESYSASGMLFIRTVANGTHFRGYINKEMVVHGHGDAPEPGEVGMAIDGSGTLLIDRVELTQLQ